MYGMGEIITETDPTKLVRELHATAVALSQAKARNDVAGVKALLSHFQAVAYQYTSTGAAADAAEFSFVDNIVLSTGDWIEKAVAAIPSAVSAIPFAIGQGLLKAALPFALLYGGYLFLRSKGR